MSRDTCGDPHLPVLSSAEVRQGGEGAVGQELPAVHGGGVSEAEVAGCSRDAEEQHGTCHTPTEGPWGG